MKKIVILGSTGSVGRQTLEVIRSLPDRFKVVGLGAGKNWRLLAEQIREYKPSLAALADENELKKIIGILPRETRPEMDWGRKGMENLAAMTEADLVVIAVSRAAGIYPTIAAIRAGKDIALANKETLVSAGQIVMELAREKKVRILPLDSEHSAVWQCLEGRNAGDVEKIILTASGGPFREMDKENFEKVTPDMALKHPNWNMGSRITIDSATMMNKGFEVIEARWLFGVHYSQIEVVIHPQSIVHSAVEFLDGSIIAQMGIPDMRLPIQYALTYPERVTGPAPRLKLADLSGLTFMRPDTERFPSLSLAFEAGRAGGTMPAVLNAANDIAVDLFLAGKITFDKIMTVVASVMQRHEKVNRPSLDEILEADRWSRAVGRDIAGRLT
ncbi:MAG TPA: 1-deoxy-D-xylulose-5-phosphate reductoisomerase [Bacillota bacterium]|nr:1-deoxy-D-xylulose-5-phosphate reductoisomerase [Bacillota bacterium]